MSRRNALWNCRNPHQGSYDKILVLCSAGLLRSPTVAGELYKRGYNTRAAGVHDYALVQVDEVLLRWADKVVLVHPSLVGTVEIPEDVEVIVLNIPDNFAYREKELVTLVNTQLDAKGLEKCDE